MAPRYCQKRFSIWRPSAVLNLQNFDFLLSVHHGNWNVHLPTKFDENRIILGWDIAIMLFSKWRSSVILDLRKLQFWPRDIYRHVILHLCSKFRADHPIWRRDIAKTISNMAPVRHLGFVMTSSYWIIKLHFTFLQLCVKFSRRLVFHVSAFGLQIAYFGLNFDDFAEK